LGGVHSAWSRDGQPELYAIDILATDATVALELGPATFRIGGQSAGRPLAGEYGDPLDRSIARFLEAARAGDPAAVFCPPADALRTLAVALACEWALEQGRVVPV